MPGAYSPCPLRGLRPDGGGAVLPPPELLREAERLAQEKLDVQRQADKDRGGLLSRLKLLESELEEQESSLQELEERRRAQTEDLQQHIQALERQLKHHRQFMDVSSPPHPGSVPAVARLKLSPASVTIWSFDSIQREGNRTQGESVRVQIEI